MTYHDNDVQFEALDNVTLVSGTYTIESHDVSSGQDPDGNIQDGRTYNFSSEGVMTFRVGRHGTSDVADWFNNLVKADQNTFGHTADKLNFAFMGTLVMTLTGSAFNNQETTITFPNIGIAQGHASTTNNWWFGGKTCTHVDPTFVLAKGTNAEGNEVTLSFKRGQNSYVNIINVLMPS